VKRERQPDPEIAARAHRRARALDAVQETFQNYHSIEQRASAEINQAREQFIAALASAYEMGTTQEELGDLLGLSRQRIAQLLSNH
jgi:hypothetical protein